MLFFLGFSLQASQEKLAELGARFENEAIIFDAKWQGKSADLQLLESLNGYKELYFLNAPISDEDVQNLVNLTWLETLALRHLKISDQALKNIGNMKKIKLLSVASCPQIKGSGLAYVAQSKSIIHLHLPHQYLDDKDVAPLEKMIQIEYLSLHSNEITTAAIKHFRNMKKLTWLFLKEVDVAVEDCHYIADLSSLRELSLTFMKLDGRHLKILSSLPILEVLRIRDTTVSDEDLKLISNFKALNYLQLKGKKNSYTNEAITWLKTNCPQVKISPAPGYNPQLRSPVKKVK